MDPILEVRNHGPILLGTNYWDLPAAAAGKVLLSPNEGAFRVLVPPSQEGFLNDMLAALGCAVSRGPWPDLGLPDAFEILWDDGSSSPFALHLSPESFDRLPGRDFRADRILTVWTRPRRGTRPHKVMERPCVYRSSRRLPDLRPWEET